MDDRRDRSALTPSPAHAEESEGSGDKPRRWWRPHPLAKPGDGPVSRYCNRYLSAAISARLARTPVTPTQVSIAVALLGIPILYAGWLGSLAGVGLLLQLASVLDGVDGELARAKGLESPFGALLDTVLDYTVDSIGIAALGLALLKVQALSPQWTLLLMSSTIAVRLISQFVVKNTPFPKAHLQGDTRDTVTFLLFLAALLAEWWTPHVIVGALLFVNLWRLDNMVYRLLVFWQRSARPSESIAQTDLTAERAAAVWPEISVDQG